MEIQKNGVGLVLGRELDADLTLHRSDEVRLTVPLQDLFSCLRRHGRRQLVRSDKLRSASMTKPRGEPAVRQPLRLRRISSP